MRTNPFAVLAAAMALLLAGCAGLAVRDPVQVTVAGVEALPSEGLEMRLLVKLRVQNPNDTPIEYDGVFLKISVQDKTFASGVSDEKGSVPRFGESVVSIPVTASTLRVALNALGMMSGERPPEKLNYRLEGKLNGPVFGSTSFDWQGELKLPGNMPR